jgi:hypothetical protein
VRAECAYEARNGPCASYRGVFRESAPACDKLGSVTRDGHRGQGCVLTCVGGVQEAHRIRLANCVNIFGKFQIRQGEGCSHMGSRAGWGVLSFELHMEAAVGTTWHKTVLG